MGVSPIEGTEPDPHDYMGKTSYVEVGIWFRLSNKPDSHDQEGVLRGAANQYKTWTSTLNISYN